MGGGGACGQTNGFVFLHQFRGGETDAAFFFGVALFARQKGTVVAKWLVEQRFDQRRSPVGAADQSAVFKPRQITANAGRGGTSHRQDLLDGCGPGAEKELDDPLRAKT